MDKNDEISQEISETEHQAARVGGEIVHLRGLKLHLLMRGDPTDDLEQRISALKDRQQRCVARLYELNACLAERRRRAKAKLKANVLKKRRSEAEKED